MTDNQDVDMSGEFVYSITAGDDDDDLFDDEDVEE